MSVEQDQVSVAFAERFGCSPRWIVRAPGRVNLIGEHTDYNDGFVLPVAIDRAVWIALAPRDDSRVVVRSLDFDEEAEFSLNRLLAKDGSLNNRGSGWIEYLAGTAWSLQSAGYELAGWDGLLVGDVPLGAGLSSSAALEVATARAFASAGGLDWDPVEMAKLGQKAENQWVGVNCGIMDQLISAAGRRDHAVLIDCRSLETRPVPFPPGVAVVILDTGTRRGLVDSAYNERRGQCEAAADFFGVQALRDVERRTLDAKASQLDETVLRRARHVITENDRTLAAVEAMGKGDFETLGQLMIESHVSLRDDFEVSSNALNAMVDSANAHPACVGSRMTGAGFGGCAVAMVESDAADSFSNSVAADYEKQTGHRPILYVCRASSGAEVMEAMC